MSRRHLVPVRRNTGLKTLAGVSTILIVTGLGLILLSQRTLPQETRDFQFAEVGDYWQLHDDDIYIRRTPRLEEDEAEFVDNLIGVVGPGIKVKVLMVRTDKSEGRWTQVFAYTTDGTVPRGWVLAQDIEKATRILSPE